MEQGTLLCDIYLHRNCSPNGTAGCLSPLLLLWLLRRSCFPPFLLLLLLFFFFFFSVYCSQGAFSFQSLALGTEKLRVFFSFFWFLVSGLVGVFRIEE